MGNKTQKLPFANMAEFESYLQSIGYLLDDECLDNYVQFRHKKTCLVSYRTSISVFVTITMDTRNVIVNCRVEDGFRQYPPILTEYRAKDVFFDQINLIEFNLYVRLVVDKAVSVCPKFENSDIACQFMGDLEKLLPQSA